MPPISVSPMPLETPTVPKPAPPRLIFWETTAGCNLRCVHCRRLEVMDRVSESDLPTDAARRLISDIASYAHPILVLSGGEPLFRPDILELASHARAEGLRVALATNGTLVTPEKARSIREAGVARVSISLDGAGPETHDRFRGPGAFSRALEGFRRLKREGVSLQINMTVTRVNVHQLDQLYQLGREEGADALHLFMLVPVGCGVEIAGSDMLSPQEYERCLHWMYDKEQEGSLELKATCAPHYFRVVRQRGGARGAAVPSARRQSLKGAPPDHQALHQTTKGCLAGQGVCFVSHRGDVFPCGYLPVPAGNVLRRSFGDIWENSPVFQRLRAPDLLEGKCGACSFKYVCGGCRARAFYQTGNYLEEEPYCDYVPHSYHRAEGEVPRSM